MNDEPMSFIAVAPCGCIRGAAVDDPAYRKETAKDIAAFIRAGLDVRKVSCDYVRTTSWRCSEHPNGYPKPTGKKKAQYVQTAMEVTA